MDKLKLKEILASARLYYVNEYNVPMIRMSRREYYNTTDKLDEATQLVFKNDTSYYLNIGEDLQDGSEEMQETAREQFRELMDIFTKIQEILNEDVTDKNNILSEEE